MAKEVTFKLNLKVDGKDVVKKLTVDVEELQRAIGETRSASDKLTVSFFKWNQISEVAQNFSSGLSQISGALNTLTAESRSFGAAMASANTMAGKSGEEFANLKSQVTELSKQIPIARDELANGLYQVVSNGVPEDNWIEYLEKSAKASVGGIADLGETVKVTSTIIKNYGLQWDAAGDIQDKIQLTAKNGVTSFEQLAQALPRVTSQAATLGVSVDELMATFATLTGVSGNTAEVSTQLAAIFTALIKPSSEAAKMAQQMGIQFDAAAIKAAGGMEQFLQQLSESVTQYSKASGVLEQEVYGRLFGSAESLRALTPLTGNLASKFQENVAAMQGSAGTIDEAFSTMASTGSSTIQLLNNKLGEYTDILQSSIGNIAPYLTFGSQISTMAASVVSLGTSFAAVVTSAKAASIAIAAYNKAAAIAMGLSSAPLLAMAAGLGVLAVGYSKAKTQIEDTDHKARELRSALANLKTEHDNNTAAIKKYLPVAQDATKKTADRKEAIAKLKALYPDYFKNLDIATSKQYNVAKAVNAANKAYRDQLVLIAKQAKQQYEKSKVNYEKNQNGGQMGGTNAGMNTMMNQQDKANMEADLKYWQEAEKAVEDYDKAMKQAATTPKPTATPTTGATTPNTPTANTTTTKNTPTAETPKETDPVAGSIDWYEKAISEKRARLTATANSETAKVLNNQMEGLQRSLYMLKVKVGMETPAPIEVAKQVKPMTEQIEEAFEDMQQQLKKNPIKVEVNSKKLEELQQKMEDFQKIASLGNVDLKSFQGVQHQLQAINSITDPTAKGFAVAGSACSALGSALQQLGADSEASKAGMVLAAIGQLVLSFAQAMTSASSNWVTWLAFGISGTAQLISIIGTISKFATGGIVGGNQRTGDNVLVRVNSGEMILNASQQARLFALANGAAIQRPVVNTQVLQDTIAPQGGGKQKVDLRLRGRDLVGSVANETRSNRRRSNIKI